MNKVVGRLQIIMHGMSNLKFKPTALRGVRYSDAQMDVRMYVHLTL